MRDFGPAFVFLAGANRSASMQRMLYDVSDAVQFGTRKPKVARGALVAVAVGVAELIREA